MYHAESCVYIHFLGDIKCFEVIYNCFAIFLNYCQSTASLCNNLLICKNNGCDHLRQTEFWGAVSFRWPFAPGSQFYWWQEFMEEFNCDQDRANVHEIMSTELTLATRSMSLSEVVNETITSAFMTWIQRWKQWWKYIDRGALLRNLFCGKGRLWEGQMECCCCLVHLHLRALHRTCNQCNQHLLQYWQCGNSGRAGREADGSQGAAVMVSGQHYLSPECHRDTIAAATDLHIPPSLHDGTRPQGTSAQRKLLTKVGVVAGRADRE